MRFQALLILSTAALGAAFAAVAQVPAMGAMTSDGLARVESAGFDEFYLRPKTDLAGYRKVMVDPAQVSMKQGWLKHINSTKDVTRWITAMDVKRIIDGANQTLEGSVTRAFRGRGYEISTAPGPGVLRLSPSVPDLWLNAPDIQAADPARFASVDAGDATLILEARDSVSGAVLARVVDRNTARQTFRLNPTTTTSNVFWFQMIFESWATKCAREFEAVQAQP